jgi:two-component system chemotaxis response regulator CheB
MRSLEAVVFGGSAGAIEALGSVLPRLPRGFPWPIVVVVHQPPGRDSLLPELFAPKCALPVREVEHGCPLQPGIYFGPPDYHLSFEQDRSLALSTEPAVRYSRPSIDVLLESAAWTFGPRVLAVLFSGANEDGALGLAAVRRTGGLVWVQSPESAAMPTMPEAGIAATQPDAVLAPEQMAERLRGLVEAVT